MIDDLKEHPLATAYNRLTPESVLGAVEGGVYGVLVTVFGVPGAQATAS
jgi:hypothetical protein